MRPADRGESRPGTIAESHATWHRPWKRGNSQNLLDKSLTYSLRTWPQRYGFAVVAVAIATLVRYGLGLTLGLLLPFAFFFLTILIVGVFAGFGPGIFATFLSVASVSYFFWAPMNSLGVSRLREIIGLALFSGIGALLSGLAHLYRRREAKLREFERVVEGLEEMILVVDREYRYVIANRAFLSYRGMKREQVIGHRMAEVVDPTVFETTVKARVDECFQGRVVQYELRYNYPTRGERDISVSYFPIEGPSGIERAAIILRDISVRKRAQDAVHDREEKFHQMADNIQEIFWMVDAATKQAIYVNPAFEQITGRTMQSLQDAPLSYREIIHPDHREHVLKRLDESQRTGVFDEEFRIVRPDGTIRWVAAQGFPVRNAEGEVYRLAGVVQDITERKRAEEALRESEAESRARAEELAAILDAVPGMVLIARDSSCRKVTGSRAAYEILRLPHGANLSKSAPEGERPSTFRILQKGREASNQDLPLRRAAATKQEVRHAELTFTFGDGTSRDFFGNAAPVLDSKGEVSGAVGAFVDITERKSAESALRASEDRYRDLVEHSEDLLCTHDLEGNLQSVNPAPARILGYDVAELLKIPMRELIPPEFREQFDQYMARIKANGTDQGLMAVLTRKGERRIWDYKNTLRTEGVSKPVVRGMAHDVTERMRAEKALRRSEENYRRFVAQSSEGIFREDLDAPVPIDLPEDQLVQRILHDSYMAECNDAMARMYGVDSGRELLGKRLTEMLIADDPRNIELTREYIRSGFRVRERESHEVDKHGNPKVFLNSMIGIVENGKLVRTWGIQRDITEKVKLEEARKKAEQALRQSEERFRVALKSSPVTVFNQDRDLRYTWIYNPVLYPPNGAEVLGKTDAEILGAERAALLDEIKRGVLETGQGSRMEIPIVHEGNHYYFDVTLEPLRDEAGNVVGLTGANMDIARLRELADHLQEQKDKLVQEKIYLEHEIQTELGFEQIIGQSPALKAALKQARVVAQTDATVLLLGETGTGKELVARSIHQLSRRRDENFIKLNCAAVPSGLLESELFGHEKGAFTGAVSQKVGRIELADGGTLFLDEIGELPLELQPKLLRVLQEREFERLGSVRTEHVDVRIIAATNRDLTKRIAEKQFRQDLFYRLNVFPIRLPALRERRSDIPLLVAHLIRKHAARMNKQIESVSRETLDAFGTWEWPGNIRELENLIERLVILSKEPVLSIPAAELEALQETARRQRSA